jgi:hypothetical protein
VIHRSHIQTGRNRVVPFCYQVKGKELAIVTEDGEVMGDQNGNPLIRKVCDLPAENHAKAIMRDALKQDGFNRPIDYPETGVA